MCADIVAVRFQFNITLISQNISYNWLLLLNFQHAWFLSFKIAMCILQAKLNAVHDSNFT